MFCGQLPVRSQCPGRCTGWSSARSQQRKVNYITNLIPDIPAKIYQRNDTMLDSSAFLGHI